MKKYIPNLLTSLNLLSGCFASVMAFSGEYLWVVVWVVLAGIFDFFDGFCARLLKAYSSIGKDLDSLADMVSFGLVPGIVVFRFISDNISGLQTLEILHPYIPYFAFLLPVFSALRLAKFNVDERQTSSFIGLPTPPNAFFWISFIYGINPLASPQTDFIIIPVISILVVIFSFLLVSEIPMFSLKVKNYKWKGNELRYLLIVSIIIAVVVTGIFGLAIGILFYIGLSIFSSFRRNRA